MYGFIRDIYKKTNPMLSGQRVVCLFCLLFSSVFVSYGQETPADWVERSISIVHANPKKALEFANRAV